MSFRRYALMLACSRLAVVRASVAKRRSARSRACSCCATAMCFEGDVTRAGDYYIVSPSEGSELRLKNDEVEAVLRIAG